MLDKFDKLHKQYLPEDKQKGVDGKACWKGYARRGTKKKGGKTVDNCVKVNESSFDKDALLDHAMNMYQQHGTSIREIQETLMALGMREGPEKAHRLALYLKNDFINDLEAKLDAYDEGVHSEKNAQCTGPTKKASSTSKGKKYMKCVKSDSGGYKRIHWGQKGAKVTGKSGNTKRKKSFRARHKCSTAKANTPRGQACKDW